MSLALGQPAPSFTARNQHGEMLAVSGLRGFTGGDRLLSLGLSSICRDGLAAVRDDHERFLTLRCRVRPVSCDAMYAARLRRRGGIAFDLLSDHWPHGAIAQADGGVRRIVRVRATGDLRAGLRGPDQLAAGEPDQRAAGSVGGARRDGNPVMAACPDREYERARVSGYRSRSSVTKPRTDARPIRWQAPVGRSSSSPAWS